MMKLMGTLVLSVSTAILAATVFVAAPVAAATPQQASSSFNQTTATIPAGAIAVDRTPPGMPTGGARATAPSGSAPLLMQASASGCLNVDAWRNEYTALGFLAYRWHVTDYFCWSGGVITSTSTGYYVSDNDGFETFLGLAGSQDYYFSSNTGHYTYREAAMQNCVWSVCLSTQYPWVSITVYGDGSWTYAAGG